MRVKAPIYAEDSVLEKAGVLLDKEGDTSTLEAGTEPVSKVGPEELEKMSAFRDFIESLDLDDFDKRKSS